MVELWTSSDKEAFLLEK